MPSITKQLSNLREEGPIIEVTLKLSSVTIEELGLEEEGLPTMSVLALIDSGASTTAISQKVIEMLGLVPTGTAEVFTSAESSERRNEYAISLGFEHGIHFDIFQVFEAHLQYHDIDCLIGRDVLEHGVFTYDGPNKKFILTFDLDS